MKVNKGNQYKIEDYGKVAVLMGGSSSEREISLQTGHAIYMALVEKGVDACPIDFQNSESLTELKKLDVDRAFIALHGRGGEDGTIQGALQTLDIPYTGSGVLGSALAMDKVRSKKLWQLHNIATPNFLELSTKEELNGVESELGFPVMVKPVQEGSSCGAAKVKHKGELEEAWLAAKKYDERVMAERWVNGREYTASILNNKVLPIIRLETPNEFYDYDAKYLSDSTGYFCPSGLVSEDEESFKKISLTAFLLVGASGWGRVDFIVDEENIPWFIEVNTVPGMTSHSLVPMAAKHADIDFNDLVIEILQTSFINRNLGQKDMV